MRKEDIRTIHRNDPFYPALLGEIHRPPEKLYYAGEWDECDYNAVAIVGARRCSSYGMGMARDLAFELASRGITIVSGMAKGIDTAAHRGALEAGGRTIAVMGAGFGHIYPEGSEGLAARIAISGAVATEFEYDVPPLRNNFPQRNRIISGLSRGVIVVEAARKSGALITADLALNEGREVFAVPGRADSYVSAGPNRLIQQGAKLVTGVEDVLEELDYTLLEDIPRDECPRALSGDQNRILGMLNGKRNAHIDEISKDTGIAVQLLHGALLRLEATGMIKALPGGRYKYAS